MNNEIKKYCEHCKFYSSLGCQSTLICKDGNKFLAADVQPVKRGKWIIVDDVEHFIAICSECGRTEDSRDIKDMPYCHCGARMDGDTKCQ